MSKRRKVGNLLGLAVLSAVALKPMHPYEIASVLRERGKDQDIKIKWGSLYTVVAQPGEARVSSWQPKACGTAGGRSAPSIASPTRGAPR